MCRISGILNPNLPLKSLEGAVQQMCAAQKHGGPDDEGLWHDERAGLVLGHRRLSLLDLSAAGHQPMIYKDRYVISYNGEVYNFQVLKKELQQLGHHFITQTDTEVILAAYEQWGTQSFAKLEGMFAFALWDKEEKKILLVRDPSGIKPLYYFFKDGTLAFASETRAFRFVPGAAEANPEWPVYMLAYGHLPEPVTTLKDVKPLPKGFFISYDAERKELSMQNFSFYSFNEWATDLQSPEKKLAALLRDSVNSHLIADAPVGVFLSGGIDSGILFLLAAELKKQGLNSLSLYFKEGKYSEKKYQDLLLEKVQCQRHQYLLDKDQFEKALPRVLSDMDQPSSDGINTWFISQYAKQQGLKAVLSGIGADELLGGYPSFKRIAMATELQNLPGIFHGSWWKRSRKYSRVTYLRMPGLTGLYLFLRGQHTPGEIARQLDADETQVWDILQQTPVMPAAEQLHKGNLASYIETNLYMQNQLLRDADAMSMAHGIEIRVPFLDHHFRQYCMGISPKKKYGGAIPKSLLIDAFKTELPGPVWNRPKMGFAFPFTEWFGSSDYVKEIVAAGGAKAGNNYNEFLSGKKHWSQWLSLQLAQNRTIA
jgi:asparagine synthase (glutamine-hydrolysing)